MALNLSGSTRRANGAWLILGDEYFTHDLVD